jgi:hypothetical protein
MFVGEEFEWNAFKDFALSLEALRKSWTSYYPSG